MPAVETFNSSNVDEDLVTVQWTGLDGIALHWERLLGVLEALAQADDLRDLSGHISVEPRAGGDEPLERWPVSLDAGGLEALRRRLSEAQRLWPEAMPDEAILRSSAPLLLPLGVGEVRVIAWDLPDPEDLGPLPLAPETRVACPPGYAAWRVRPDPETFEEDAPLYLVLTSELSKWAQQLRLGLRSRYDLWRPHRFDGSSAAPTGTVNFERLRESMARIAARTDGTLLAP